MKFAQANDLKNRSCKIVLMDQEARAWPAKLGHKKSDGQVYIGQGWSAFCVANHLKAGDSFLFELIKKGRWPILQMCSKLYKNSFHFFSLYFYKATSKLAKASLFVQWH